jgi:hypothetical protein
MISTVMEYLQGIQMAKAAANSFKNGSGNQVIVYGYLTRADDTYTEYDMCSNALLRR